MQDGSPHRRSRAGLWFAAGTVVSLLLLLASRTPQALAVQEATAHALDPVRSAISGVGAGISGFFTAIGEIDRLRSENDRLRRELAVIRWMLIGVFAAVSIVPLVMPFVV